MTVDHAKVRIDLDDCQRALGAFWTADEPLRSGEETLYGAIEALLRAVSTLAHGLEAREVGS